MSDVTIRHRIEYLALRMALCSLQQLPVQASLDVAGRFGVLAYRLLKKRTIIGRENIAAAFPGMHASDVEELLIETYRNLFRTAVEVFYLRRMISAATWRRYVDVEDAANAVRVFLEGKGGILISGHLGNWELLGHVLPYIGITSQAVIRPLDNPLLDRYILGVRTSGLQRIVLKRGAGASIERTLGGGGFVSLLADQDAGRKGAFVPFFGRPASTWRSTALLSQSSGAPILPGCCVRTGDALRFKVIVGEPIYPDAAADVTAETLRMTAAFTSQLEGWVREYPEQYLWLHRRWKSVPGPRSLVSVREG